MSELTTYRWSLLDDVTQYSDAGIGAIGIWRPKLVEFGEERGIELLRDSDLAVSSVSWAGGFTGTNGHSLADAIDDATEALRLCADLGAKNLVIASGPRSGHTSNHARKLVVSALQELSPIAAAYGVGLVLQPMHRRFAREWTFLTSLDEMLDVLERVDSRYVQMVFDVYHLWQEPRIIERIPEIVPFIGAVQLSDWKESPQSENDRCLLGDGQIPLDQFVAALVGSNYDGYFDIQIWSEEVWQSNYIKVLARCQTAFESLYPQGTTA